MDKIVTTQGLARHRPAKNRQNPFLEVISFRERRASHADPSRDLRRPHRRPRLVDGAGTGQPFENPTGRRADADRVIVVQRDAADAGWNVAAAAVSGNGFPTAISGQIRGAKSGAPDALSTIGLVTSWFETRGGAALLTTRTDR
jgi:hypothetical protein